MTAKNIKKFFTAFVCAALVACTAVVCSAAGSKIQIEKLDNMTIQLPDNMLGITRDSKSTDKYFSVFGLDYDKTMSDFKSSDIFMQAMDNQATTTVTVTMTRNGDSEGIKNYKLLSDEKLYEVRESFISQEEYISCTPDQAQDLVWLMFDLNVESGSDRIKTYQANTVYDGMSINITIQHNGGDVTSADYQTLKSILSTVTFNAKADPESDFTKYVYIGIVAVVIILFIIVMIAGKKTRKKNKKSKNEKILRELTDKYKSNNKPVKKLQEDDTVSIHQAYDESKEENNDISSSRKDDDLFDDYKDIDEEEVKVKIYEKPTVSDYEIDEIVNESKERLKNEGADVEVIETSAEKLEPQEVIEDRLEEAKEDLQTEEVVQTVAVDEPEDENEAEENSEITEEADADATDTAVENQSEEKVISDDGKYEEAAQAEISTEEEPTDEIEETIEEVESEYEEETEDKVEEENEEELRREAEKNTADDFDEGYEFFEEKPRRIVGIIDVDSSDLKNAVDYDVLSEEEKRAVEVETAVDNDKTESFIAAAEKAGNGIKNFFAHCGYFCTNVSRLISVSMRLKSVKKQSLSAEKESV